MDIKDRIDEAHSEMSNDYWADNYWHDVQSTLAENKTLKTTNETLNGTVAMLKELIEIGEEPEKSCYCPEIWFEKGHADICKDTQKALTATKATVAKWMAKRDEEHEASISARDDSYQKLGDSYAELEVTIQEKEKELAVIKNENKSLSDAYSEVSHDQKKAEEALAKRDKEAMMLREALVEWYEHGSVGMDYISNLLNSSTANLGARYKAELLRAEVRGVRRVLRICSFHSKVDKENAGNIATALTKEADALESKEKTK